MFTLSEIEIIMQKRKDKMLALLRELSFRATSQNLYEEIDTFVTKEVCRLMKSDSVAEGYSFLFRAAGIPLIYSETPNEKLAKIAANRAEIERSIIRQATRFAGPKQETHFTVSTVKEIDLKALKKDFNVLKQIAESANYVRDYINAKFILQISQDFNEEFLALEKRMKSLPDTACILGESSSKPCSEGELLSFLETRKPKDTFFVSVSRDEVQSKPDPSLQFRIFTPDEASYMLDILEQINDIVSVL